MIKLRFINSKGFTVFSFKFKKGFPKIFKSTPDFMDWLYGMYKDMAPDKVDENIQDAAFNLDKIFGDDQESIETFQDIEDNGTVKDMIEFIDEFGNEEMLKRYGIRSSAAVKKLAKHIMQESIDEVNDGKKKKKKKEFHPDMMYEGIVKDLKKIGDEINYLVDADDDTKKIWKKAGFDTEDDDNVILYSYVSSSWPETKKLLDKKRVKYKELEDPNSAGESYIVFKESLNENKNLKDMSDTDLIATLDHFKTGPANIRDLSDRLIKNLEEDIEAIWKKTYGEDFKRHYPAVAKIIRQRRLKDKREIARIWQDTYGEDFEKEYPALYQKLS